MHITLTPDEHDYVRAKRQTLADLQGDSIGEKSFKKALFIGKTFRSRTLVHLRTLNILEKRKDLFPIFDLVRVDTVKDNVKLDLARKRWWQGCD
jgi:hypothetical protein